jgi:DNA polymerase
VDLREALTLQVNWGADEALEDAPVDRFAKSSSAKPMSQGDSRAPSHAITQAELAAQAAAAAATIDELRAAIAAFDGCTLRDTASHPVFSAGEPTTGLMLIGEAPEADDDRFGMPFAGQVGAYLDRMLASIGLNRAQLLVTPLIPWRPPGDRLPNRAELAICLAFLHRLIAIVSPRRLLLMGALPARALLPPVTARRHLRGAWMDAAIPGIPYVLPALPTFSPAELMRSPNNRRAAWADLRLLRRTLDAEVASA